MPAKNILTVIFSVAILWSLVLIAAGTTRENVFIQPVYQPEKMLSVCNAAPYKIETEIFDLRGREIDSLPLESGYCKDFNLSIPEEGAVYFSKAVPSAALSRLQEYDFFQNSWNGAPILTSGKAGVWGCFEASTGAMLGLNDKDGCRNGGKSIELGYLRYDATRFQFFIEDPHVCSRVNPRCNNMSGLAILNWASTLNQSLGISWRAFADAGKSYGLIPTASGLETQDRNGPFTRGILLTKKQAEFTPLGSPIPGKRGDIIISFNGKPIYDRDDFIMLAIEHGATKGYEEPYSIEFQRGHKSYLYEGFMVFHRGIYGSFFLNSDGSCKNVTGAILSSALDEATFYTKSILACINFDINEFPYADSDYCEFSVRQLTAAYRQYCPGVSRGAAIIGSVFMPGREAVESVIKKLTVKKVSRIVPALIVEGVEEGLRSVITLPPGINLENSWSSIGQQVGFGMAVGVGVRLVTLK